ncbi:hypothetical protein [Bordetella bronchiseptica]|uniref:hypothetical protein n=1 Tax=Bordetella bronchiseptica TaxID=518 RepID=UPI00081C3E51|nr:hypothetical protein [Bordetella bronchiseptica]AOB27483.1 hypothetical protein BBB44_15130 [Bordetella bronchiseptica]AZW44801.1 hypothetical protein CWR61_15285 [Bordetella bronchiseptica]
MKFFSLKDRIDDLKWSHSTGGKILNGAKLVGAVVANTAIGAGKVVAEIADNSPQFQKRLEETKKRKR